MTPTIRAVRQDDDEMDDCVRRFFGVEPPDDPSGLDGSRSSLPPSEADEDAQFEAYMRTLFPASVRPHGPG